MSIRYFVMKDAENENKDCREVKTPAECKKYNQKGYGVFMTFNTFKGTRRLAENVTEICFWACDIDEGTKEEQMKRINALVIKPSIIIESKKGFHCYWKAKNATIKNYGKIEKGIIKKLNGDTHCKDPLRLLRVPNYYHLKDKNNPYLITVKYAENKSFEEQDMLYYFGIKEQKRKVFKGKLNLTNLQDYEKYFKINQVCKGERNAYLFWVLNRLIDNGLPDTEIRQVIEHLNSCLSDSLSECEVNQLLRGKKIL